jgi:hypothetical protein
MGNKQGHHEHDEAKEASQAPTEKAKPTKEAEDREFQLRQHRMKKRHSVSARAKKWTGAYACCPAGHWNGI